MRLAPHLFRVAILCAFAMPRRGAAQRLTDRPFLPKDADRNDWQAFYDFGISQLRSDSRLALAAFTWASHLRPDRPEPLYARWIAFWAAEGGDRFGEYLRDDEKVLRDPRVRSADSLRSLALDRSPFVHQGLVIFLYDQLPGRFRDDAITRGWIALGNAELPQALNIFGRLVATDPARYGYLRFIRASAFVNSNRPDSATAEIAALLAQLRAADAKSLGSGYQSKELLEYAMGLLMLNKRNVTAARDAFGRSIVENASFAPAHARLGEMLVTRDSAAAFAELALASELAPNDAELHLQYGNALLRVKRSADAIVHFRTAIRLEPFYAEPYFRLATALETSGDARGAAEAFGLFAERAPASDTRRSDAERKAKAP